MERLNVLSDARKGRFSNDLRCTLSKKELLTCMLHKKPDSRPEAREILSQNWVSWNLASNSSDSRIKDNNSLSIEGNTMGIDILNEEILDN